MIGTGLGGIEGYGISGLGVTGSIPYLNSGFGGFGGFGGFSGFSPDLYGYAALAPMYSYVNSSLPIK